MHSLGLAALRLHGGVPYDAFTSGLSLVIAMVAAALWAALDIRSTAAVAVASLVMGAAVNSMHCTGMVAVGIAPSSSVAALPGATVHLRRHRL